MTAAVLLQHAIGALAPFVLPDLGMSRSQLGLLVTVPSVVAALLSARAGAISDRVGGRAVLRLLFLLSALATAVAAASPTYPALLAAVALLGVGMSLNNPVTNLLIAQHVPIGRRGTFIGVKQGGVKVSQFLAGLALPGLAGWMGWRASLACLLGVQLLGWVFVGRFVPGDSPPSATERPKERESPAEADGLYLWLAAFALLMAMAQVATPTYLPLYAVEELDMTPVVGGVAAALVAVVGLCSRLFLGGWFERRSSAVVPLVLLAAGASLSSVVILMASILGEWLIWFGAVAIGATAGSWSMVVQLTVVRAFPAAQVGRASGVVQRAFYAGVGVGPLAFGFSVDQTGNYLIAWGGMSLVFASACAVLVTYIARRPRLPA